MSVESYVVPVSMDCHWHVLEKTVQKGVTPTGLYFLLSFFFSLLCLMALLY